jgi:sugar lactone lactonase YvrE
MPTLPFIVSKTLRQALWPLLAFLLILAGRPMLAIESYANGVNLVAGGATGSVGSVQVGSSSSTQLNFTVGSDVTVNSVEVLTLGASGKDFTLSGSVATPVNDNSMSVTVQFAPSFPGQITGAVVFEDVDSNILYTLPLTGTGQSPMISFMPPVAPPFAQSWFGVIPQGPVQMAMDGLGDTYYADYAGYQVLKSTSAGVSQVSFSSLPNALGQPTGIAVDGSGKIYVDDPANNWIVMRDTAGTVTYLDSTNQLNTSLSQPGTLALDGSGNLYIADTGNNRVVQLVTSPVYSWQEYAIPQNATRQLNITTLAGIAVAQDGSLYLADSGNPRVLKVTNPFQSNASFTTVNTGPVTLVKPNGLAVDAMGNLYIADSSTLKILRVPPAGGTAVVLDQQASDAPQTMAVLRSGDVQALYNPTAGGFWVGTITMSQPPALTFANTAVGGTSTDSPQPVTVTNLGNAALTFSPAVQYPADFPVNSADTNLISSSIAAGASADVSVTFVPQSAGSLAESVTLTDNSLNQSGTQQAIAVSGTGLAASTNMALASSQMSTTANGWELMVTATITNTSAGSVATRGVVNFQTTFSPFVGTGRTQLPQPVAVNGSGVATFVIPNAIPGHYSITANYSDSTGSYAASGPVTAQATVNQNTPTVTLTSSQNPAPYQGTVTFTATVVPATTGYTTSTTPTGPVNFFDGTTEIGSVAASAGVASFSTNLLAAGSHSITAQYAGDVNYAPANSPSLSQSVQAANPSATTVSCTATPGLAAASAPVTLTAKVTATAAGAGTPTGSVTFMDGSSTLATIQLDATGTASTQITSLSPGPLTQTHSLKAVYSGASPLFLASQSATRQVTVYKPLAQVALVSSANPAKAGTMVTLTATLAPNEGATATPTGSVQFYDDFTLLGTVSLSRGTASLQASSLKAGILPHAITAVYAGDANYLGGAGELLEVINPAGSR